MKKFAGNIVDIINNRIFTGKIEISSGKIINIIENNVKYDNFIIPGFIDAHIHIESSMMPPSEFARIAVKHGTIGAVSDPHEIANVLGIEGVNYMIYNAKNIPFYFYFSAPSCVPATNMETSGAKLDENDIEILLKNSAIKYLGEMMNFPGVINNEKHVMEKIEIAKKLKKHIDGHAPGLIGDALDKYINAGIETDHECLTRKEALEKLSKGMKIILRKGSAADNFSELLPIIKKYPNQCMFCSDDKHPNDLIKGHINIMLKESINKGCDLIDVLRIASLNPIKHYGLEIGLLQENDSADFIIIDNIKEFNILKTVIKGNIVYENGKTKIERKSNKIINNFNTNRKTIEDFAIKYEKEEIDIIKVLDKQIITEKEKWNVKVENGNMVQDIENDILKIAVINRYENKKPSIWFIKNFTLKSGAIASSIAHDSHNIIVVGTNDYDMCNAVNLIIDNKGGISIFSKEKNIAEILKLPIAGLMSNEDFSIIAKQYSKLDNIAKQIGSKLSSPFMTLSFMALIVIPEIKISDRGIFEIQN